MSYNHTDSQALMLKGYLEEMPPLADIFSVKGKVALVTGGTGGLGFCVTKRLLEGGARVMTASYSEKEAENTLGILEEIGYGPDRVQYCKVDVTDEESVRQMVEFTDRTFGTIDILVTAAAIWNYAHIYDLPAEEFEKVVNVNLNGTFRTVKHVS